MKEKDGLPSLLKDGNKEEMVKSCREGNFY